MMANEIDEKVIENFNPNAGGYKGHLFGLPFTPENATIVIVPVPWEVTVSYHGGTASAPSAILKASAQVDLFVKDIPDAWKCGISMFDVPVKLAEESEKLRDLATQYVRNLEERGKSNANDPVLRRINESCENLNIYVKSTTANLLKNGKLVALLGGDHSTPLGFLRALAEKYDRFAVLQIDAHADLRKSYQGFTYSHASIMYNALKIPAVGRLVQVGIRDFCEEEMNVIHRAQGRVVTWFDQDIREELYAGGNWDEVCDKILEQLPTNVYISFDIDGLNPGLCPNTGTPVPGGLEFPQATHLIKRIAKSGKRIIGFDLNEVAPGRDNDWDANVGARLLYHLANWMAVSQGRLKAV